MTSLRDEPQWSETNVPFLRALVDAARIPRPFYLAGHSYGGHHMVYFALRYPELLKGLIFLDSSGFSALDTLETYLEIVMNVQPSGVLSIVLDLKLLDYESAFEEQIQISEMPDDVVNAFLASIKSGTYVTGYFRENSEIDRSREHVTQDLAGNVINIPTLVIDAGGSGGWFPSQNFAQYNASRDFVSVDGATHTSLTLSSFYGNVTATHIREFVQRVQNGEYSNS